MKTSLLPATRVDPKLRVRIEALLSEGETLSSFIESAVLNQANWRDEQRAFVARGLEAEASGDWVEPAAVFKAVRTAAGKKRRKNP
ncbi:MAG: YlcI/YnfO family protein [Archangium sp.]